MTWPVQDLADAFLALLRSAPGSPSLQVFDGAVPAGATTPYALVYLSREKPSASSAPDSSDLTFASRAIDTYAYVHCVGADPQAARAARAVAGRVEDAVLDKTLTVPGWQCSPIRWDSGNPPERNEETGTAIFDQVDVYRWRSVPA